MMRKKVRIIIHRTPSLPPRWRVPRCQQAREKSVRDRDLAMFAPCPSTKRENEPYAAEYEEDHRHDIIHACLTHFFVWLLASPIFRVTCAVRP